MNKLVWLILALVVVAVPITLADWGLETHKFFAKQVCNSTTSGSGCDSCATEMQGGAVYPDTVLKNSIDQHIYHQCVDANEMWCDPGKLCQTCFEGEITDSVGLDRMNEALARAKTADGCTVWRNVGIAGHYYFETKLYWNNVKGETDFCRNTYTQDIEGQIQDDLVVFNTTRCGISVTDENITEWAIEFAGIAEGSLPSAQAPAVSDQVLVESQPVASTYEPTTTASTKTSSGGGWLGNFWSSYTGMWAGLLSNWGWGQYAGIVGGFVLFIVFIIIWKALFGRKRR